MSTGLELSTRFVATVDTFSGMPTPFDRYRGAILHRTAWQEVGVHQRRLASSDFVRVFPGYHALASPPPLLTAMASVLQRRIVPGAIISHTTAALHGGMPLPARLENGVGLLGKAAGSGPDGSLSIPSVRYDPGADDMARRRHPAGSDAPAVLGGRGPRVPAAPPPSPHPPGPRLPLLHCWVGRSGPSGVGAHDNVAVHRSDIDVPIARAGALVVTSPLRTLLDLATMMPVWDVVAVIDAVIAGETLVRRVSLGDVQDFAAQMSGMRGVAALRRAAQSARAGVRSPGETLTRLLVVEAGFGEPVPNLEVVDPRTGHAPFRRQRLERAEDRARVRRRRASDTARAVAGR
ncbi:hypothetical protein [Brachybacterium subflavum]|uniref:hypothetical protein n=1 Tax=Brachybacterium subflavum TaxID=2585206 RepID=UPI0012666CD6|nr:hypothetical protein [Brachybacterium subflavum]